MLNTTELKILGFIREGRNCLADFADILMVSSPEANHIAEKLELEGYVVREAYVGIGQFNWLLTDKGAGELSPLSAEEKMLLEETGITLNQYKILVYADAHPKSLVGQICKDAELPGNEMVPDLCFLVDHGFLLDGGLARRNVSTTEKGATVVKKFKDTVKI